MRAAPSPLRRIEVGTAERPLRLLAIQPIEQGHLLPYRVLVQNKRD
jgi:hypothetical protein